MARARRNTAVLPSRPFDGQSFIGSDGMRWRYDGGIDAWVAVGLVSDLPTMTDELAALGEVGLLSAADKALVDALPSVGGGLGIIVRPQLLLSSPDNPDGIISGDIELRSESLDVTCVTAAGLEAGPGDLTS